MKIRRKTDSWLMHLFGFFIGPTFMDRFWTTIGSTIYTPTLYDDDANWGSADWCRAHKDTLDHEEIHIRQSERFTLPGMALLVVGPAPFLAFATLVFGGFDFITGLILFILTIVTAPLSVGLAWGRWRIERVAYMIQIVRSEDPSATIDWVAETLWRNYAWTWPRRWMRAWFVRELARTRR